MLNAAGKSRLRLRHVITLMSFLIAVVLPSGLAGWYLWTRAADQYASFVGFSVRSEEATSAISSVLGPLDLSGSATPDAEILYEFIQSQDLIARIDGQLDIRQMWSKPDPSIDPIFAYHPPGTIEDLRDYWHRMVKIVHDSGTGIMRLRVQAFAPEDAKAIAMAIADESTRVINELSIQAREDAIRYAKLELETAVARLKDARRVVTEFRNRTQIVDPSIDVQGQASLLSELNVRLADALIDIELLRETTSESDARIAQAERRIRAIEIQIADEKRKLGLGGDTNEVEAFATLIGEYEGLVVDREFAEQSYTAALAAYDAAQAEARRQTRYLAVHLQPTLAEAAEYPQREILWALLTFFSTLIWIIVVLVGYSLRDRR